MSPHEDDASPDRTPWTAEELKQLHEMARDYHMLAPMIRDYDRARWLRGQLKWWAIWLLGLPTAIMSIWQALDSIWHKFK